MENILSEPDFSQDFALNTDFETIKTCLKSNPRVEQPQNDNQLMPLRTREETEEDQPSDALRTKEETEADNQLIPLRTQDSNSTSSQSGYEKMRFALALASAVPPSECLDPRVMN